MAKRINRRRALTPIPAKIDPQLRTYLQGLQEIAETGDGVRGNPLDRKLTVRDLIDSGLARLRGYGGGYIDPGSLTPGPPGDSPPDMSIPPAPEDFYIVPVLDCISIGWRDPFSQYNNHAYAEIWRAPGLNASFDQAVLIGSSNGSTYSDYTAGQGKPWTYWIRFVSTSDVHGPWHNPQGSSVTSLVKVATLIKEISGQIDESVLAETFRDRIDGFQETISEQGDQYTLTLNRNGYVSGFGTYNDGKTSDFAILADRFWVASPNNYGAVKPFVVQGNKTYIDTAMIRDATIDEGKLGPISFGKIKDRYGRPVTTVSGKLKAENIDVDRLRVTNANFSGDLWSTNYSPGRRGWKIWRNGDAEFNNATVRGTLFASDIVGGVNVIQSVEHNGATWAAPGGAYPEIARFSVSLNQRQDGYVPFFMLHFRVDSRDSPSTSSGTKMSGLIGRVEVYRNGGFLRAFESGALGWGLAGGISISGSFGGRLDGRIEFVCKGGSYESHCRFFQITGLVGGLA